VVSTLAPITREKAVSKFAFQMGQLAPLRGGLYEMDGRKDSAVYHGRGLLHKLTHSLKAPGVSP
jgi:hypothetical protein